MVTQPGKYKCLTMAKGECVRKIYAGFVNGIAIPTDGVREARLTCKTETIGIKNYTKLANEKEWFEVKNKSKKVRFMKQDQFGLASGELEPYTSVSWTPPPTDMVAGPLSTFFSRWYQSNTQYFSRHGKINVRYFCWPS